MDDAAPVRVERTYDVPAERLFDAWTNPDVMRRWWHTGDSRWENTVAEVDLRVGGRLRTVMRSHGNTSLVEVDLRSEPMRTTTVPVSHSGLPDEDSKAGHA